MVILVIVGLKVSTINILTNADIRISDAIFILTYARGCKYSLEKMKQKIELHQTLKAALPEFFSNYDPMRPEIRAALSAGSQLPMPEYDHLGLLFESSVSGVLCIYT